MLFVMMIMHIVKCAQYTEFTAWLSINQMIMEYADDEYYNMHRNSRYIILVYIIKTLICFDNWQPCLCETYRTCECRTTTDSGDQQLWNKSLRETHAMLQNIWEYPSQEFSACFLMITWIHVTSHTRHIFFHIVVLYTCYMCNCEVPMI